MAETWTLNYEPEGGGRLTGKLTVDDEALKFVALYDSSNAAGLKLIAGIAGSLAATGGNLAYVRNSDTELELVLPKSEIAKTTTKKKLLAKRVIVTMNDGKEFVFNYGMLSVDKLAKAIES
jgi:hypothetical protein